ncbi:MAG: DUF1802 family protein [Pedosphaera parvula]|nr:DUF1802 family protein [Pedosphaera parvula]
MKTAFKEWAVMVDALGRGDQVLMLRKGGISEGRDGFQVDHSGFLLFPTFHHQQREAVIPEAQRRYDELLATRPSGEAVRFTFYGEVVDWRQLDSPSALVRLRGQHVWRDEVVAQRFEWGTERGIYALAVRVFRLAREVELPLRKSYGGCKSWVELDVDVATEGAQPVLSDRAFTARLERFQSVLEPMPAGSAAT